VEIGGETPNFHKVSYNILEILASSALWILCHTSCHTWNFLMIVTTVRPGLGHAVLKTYLLVVVLGTAWLFCWDQEAYRLNRRSSLPLFSLSCLVIPFWVRQPLAIAWILHKKGPADQAHYKALRAHAHLDDAISKALEFFGCLLGAFLGFLRLFWEASGTPKP
jgi:hypothetical protein